MNDSPDIPQTNIAKADEAGRFLRIFIVLVVLVAMLVAAVNLVAYRYMLREGNQSIVQLLAGWGRMYKPILYDELKPAVAVYGASWARDAFDPIETGRLLNRTVFNHAVSGGTAYETRRFGDSSVDNPNLEVAIINLDTFYRSELVARTRYGFDESILDVDTNQNPNRWVAWRRAYSLTLTGWAAGANLKLISTIRARDRGLAQSEYLEAYERADHTRRSGHMKQIRDRVFPQSGKVSKPVPREALSVAVPAELEIMVDRFCAAGVDVNTYFTPAHVRQQSCDLQASEKLAVLELLREKQASCASTIRYFDFAYPNAVTLEGVLTPVKSSRYYRPDGHPRPTMGDLMMSRMFGLEFPNQTPAIVKQDFGVDLLAVDQPQQWLLERAARCEGDWGRTGYSGYLDDLTGSQN